jgi:type III pantothenate kinase
MLLAIDVGNTDTKLGLSDGSNWLGIWRRPTHGEGDLASWLSQNMAEAGIEGSITAAACVSVVPDLDGMIIELSRALTGSEPRFLRAAEVSLKIYYQPPNSLGADRIANVLGALKQYPAPVIAVDFGTATTLDVCSQDGILGGAILPGVKLQITSLAQGTSKLPEVDAIIPESTIGQSTASAIQSGVVLGHVAAVEGLVARAQNELGVPATVLGTGGLSHLFIGLTPAIHHFMPQLTLDGVLTLVEG